MTFQRSVVHWKRGIKPWFVIGTQIYHWMRVMSQDLNKNIQNAEEKEAQMLLWASTMRIYLKCPIPYYRRIHGINATTRTAIYHVQRWLYHYPSTLQLILSADSSGLRYNFYISIFLGNHFHHEDNTHTRTLRHLKLLCATSAYVVLCTLLSCLQSCHFRVTAFHFKVPQKYMNALMA